MSVRRVSGVTAVALAILMWAACGQVYRPVVIPCTGNSGVPGCPVEPLPTPANFHAVYALYANAPNGISASTPNYPGGAMQIDVTGDSIIAETPSNDTKFGNNPTHAAILPNNARVFVASAGSVFTGGLDVVSSFTTAPQLGSTSGFGPVTTINLPALAGQNSAITALSETGNIVTATLSAPLLLNPSNPTGPLVPVGTTVLIAGETASGYTGYNGTFVISTITPTSITFVDSATGLLSCSATTMPPVPCPPAGTASVAAQPVFLASTQNSAIFVANYNSNSVSQINTTTNVVSNSVSVPNTTNPVAMAELPNGQKLYVANQGSNNISTLNTVTLAGNTPSGIVSGFTGTDPVWVVARNDSQKVYVVTQGDGQLWTIDTVSDSVVGSQSVGAGANFIFYDPNLNRLYVTNPVTSMLYVFSDTGGANDTPVQLAAISFGTGSAMCPSGCAPESVTALPNGSRFYVASYQLAASCPDPVIGSGSACVIPTLSVFDANSLAPEITPALTLLSWSPSGTTQGPFAPNQYALLPSPACTVTTPYSPVTIRFRVFTTASADSSRVFVSMCDAGAIADINTTGNNQNNPQSGEPADTLVTDLPAPFSSGTAPPGGEPPNQSPIFMLSGQ